MEFQFLLVVFVYGSEENTIYLIRSLVELCKYEIFFKNI